MDSGAGIGRLPVPGLLTQRDQGLDRLRTGDEPLAARLAALVRRSQSSSLGRHSGTDQSRIRGGSRAAVYPIQVENAERRQGDLALSEVGDGTDYYFSYGPSVDQVI